MHRGVTTTAAAGALYLLVGLVACAPAGPSVSIIRPDNKPPEMFAQEHAACMQYATQQTLNGHANFDDGIAAAVLHVPSFQGGSLQANPQQFFDLAYAECMVRQGNILPGYAPRPVAAPAPRKRYRPRRKVPPPVVPGQAPEFVEPPPAEP